MEDKRIFITGSTGFIGRHVVARLLDDGHRLTLGVRDAGRCLDEWRRHPGIAIVETGALEDAANMDAALSDASTVIHLAGKAGIAKGDRSHADAQFMRANADSTARLAEAAAKAGVRCFVNMSSIFAVSPNHASDAVDDDAASRPSTAYGRSKLAAEEHVGALAAGGVFAVSLRPPLVIGADAKGNWAGLQRLAASGLPLPFANLRNRRSLIGVGTLSEAVSLLSSRAWPVEKSGAFCIADPEALSLAEIIAELRRGMELPARLFAFPPALFDLAGKMAGRQRQIAGLTRDLVVDPSRFFSTFGFRPSLGLREAIRRSGAAYRAVG